MSRIQSQPWRNATSLQNRIISPTAPSAGDALRWNAAQGRWEPSPVASDLPIPDQVGQSIYWDGNEWIAGNSIATPGAPHPDDDEFEGPALDPAWSPIPGTGYTSAGIDVSKLDVAEAVPHNTWSYDVGGIRRSWLMMSARFGDYAGEGIIRTHATAPNEGIFVRLRSDMYSATVMNVIGLMNDATLDWNSLNHHYLLQIKRSSLSTNNTWIRSRGLAHDPTYEFGLPFDDETSVPFFPEFVFLQKTGMKITLWISPDGNHWRPMTGHTRNVADSFTHFGLGGLGGLCGYDFVRFRPGIWGPP